MTGQDRIALAAHLAFAALTLVAFAAARPAPPPGLEGRRGPLALLGRWGAWVGRPLAAAARAAGVSLRAFTWLGATVTAAAGLLAATGTWGWSGLALLWGSAYAMLAGPPPGRGEGGRPGGAFLDANPDRLGEVLFYLGVAAGLPTRAGAAAAVAAALASLAVSAVRVHGDRLGVERPGHGLDRPQRLVIMLSFLLPAPFLAGETAAWLVLVGAMHVAVGGGLTAAARLLVIRRRHLARAATAGRLD